MSNPATRLLYRAGCNVLLKHGVYYWWSRHYRRWHERGLEGHVPLCTSVDQCLTDMLGFRWRADGPRQFWDAIGYPRSLEETGEGDCDEFAVWWLDAGRELLFQPPTKERPVIGGTHWQPIGLLSVPWCGGGHNVAVFAAPEPWHCSGGALVHDADRMVLAHASNRGWFDEFEELDQVAHHVASLWGQSPMCWSLVSADLKTRIGYQWIGEQRGDKEDRRGHR